MQFTISAEILLKLSSVRDYIPLKVPESIKSSLETIYVEHKSGKTFAVATNSQIASIYCLGETEEEDGHCFITVTDALKTQAMHEEPMGSFFEFVIVPEIAMGTVKSMMGWTSTENYAVFFDESPLMRWRDWIPVKEETIPSGRFFIDTDMISILMNSSPSGMVTTLVPVDTKENIVFVDLHRCDWAGVFVGTQQDNKHEEVEKPEWLS